MSSHRTVLVIADSHSCPHSDRYPRSLQPWVSGQKESLGAQSPGSSSVLTTVIRAVQDDGDCAYTFLTGLYTDKPFLPLHPSQAVDGLVVELGASVDEGLELVCQLRAQLTEPMGDRCPPILVVGGDDAATAVQALKQGAVDYLIRDRLTPKDLRVALDAAIAPALSTPAFATDHPAYRELAEAMPQMVWTADAVGVVNYWNQRWYTYTGLTEGKPTGIIGMDTVHPDERDRTLAQWKHSVSQGKAFEVEHRIQRWDGTYRWFISRAIPTRGSQGQITGWIGTLTDIDDQKRLEERLQLVMRAVNGLVYDWNLQTNEVYRSEKLYELIGIHPDETPSSATWWHEQIHPDDHARLQPHIEALLAGNNELGETEYRIRHADGHWVDVWERSCLLRDGQGRVIRMVGSTVDITDRKRAELALREAHIQLESALAAGAVYTWRWSLSDNCVITNRSFAHLFGVEAEAASTGLPIETFIQAIHPDDRTQVIAAIDRAIATGERYAVEFRIHNADGEERWVIARGQVEYDAHGNPIAFPGALADITERKQTQQELQESEERFRTLADNISQFAWMTDENGWIFWYNRRWFDYTGSTLEDVQGWGWQQWHHPDHVERVATRFRQCIETGETWEDTFPLRGRDGQYRWFLSRAIPLRDQQGNVQRWFGTNTDVTELRQTEIALQQATERLNLALKSAPLTLFNQDLDLRYTWVYNPTPNLSIEEILGRRDEDLVSPETAAWLTRLKRQVLETGIGVREEVKFTESNQTTYFDLTIDPIRNNQNAIVGITCAAVNISDRICAEMAMRKNEHLLRLALAGAEAGSWDWEIPTGNITWSPENFALYGLDPAQVLPRYEDWYHALHPEDRDPVEAEVRRVVEQHLPEFKMEFRILHPIQGVRWILGLGRLSLDEQGNSIRMSGINLDITDRKQAEDALRSSEERYRCLAELIPQLVWTANADGSLLDVNQRWADFTGLTLEQAKTNGWEKVVHPDDIPVLTQRWAEAVQRGKPYEAEGRMRQANGLYRWHLHQAIPQFNEQGQIVKWFGTATDIHAQKHLEIERDHLLRLERTAREYAERANRIKDEFLAVLSHELRSPLNPILGWTKLLQSGKLDAVRTTDALATIERNAKLQTQLIDDLLDIARILRGKLSLNLTPVNLSFVVEAAIDTVKATAEAKAVVLHSALPNIGQVSGDATRLQQIVWNLLSNAIKFTPAGGRVDVRLEKVEGLEPKGWYAEANTPLRYYAQITVTDTGKGIRPEFLPYIFESFRQEDASTTRKYGGLGLGLAIVRQLVEAHGGTITADSPGEGSGATFTICLPLLKEAPETQPPKPLFPSQLDLTGVRVLAVDDDPDSRELLDTLLTQYGAAVLTVSCAADLLAQLSTFRPDVLVSDIGMPDVDGYSLIQQLRSLPDEEGGQLPAIALTAYAREEDYRRAIASGFQKHVTKPLDPEKLVQAIVALV